MVALLSENRILVVEDELLIALDLTSAIEEAEGIVIGPVRSAADALSVLGEGAVDGAILIGRFWAERRHLLPLFS